MSLHRCPLSFLELQSFKPSITATLFDDGPNTEATMFDSDVDDDTSSLKYGNLLLEEIPSVHSRDWDLNASPAHQKSRFELYGNHNRDCDCDVIRPYRAPRFLKEAISA